MTWWLYLELKPRSYWIGYGSRNYDPQLNELEMPYPPDVNHL